MTEPVTYIRSDDLLDETPPRRLARQFGLTRRRQLIGAAVAAITLPLLTVVLDQLSGSLALDGQVLVYLLAVVLLAVGGGIVVGVGSAIAAALLINYFFVEPVHTLDVADGDQAVTLVVFVAVAPWSAARSRSPPAGLAAAERARAEAETLSSWPAPGSRTLNPCTRSSARPATPSTWSRLR